MVPQPDGAILAVYALTLFGVAANTRWIHLGLEDASKVAVARVIAMAQVFAVSLPDLVV